MQRQLAFLRYAVGDAAFELRIQRQHGAEDFAERREIVVGNPAAEAQQLFVENRSGVEYAENGFCFDGRGSVVQFDHDASHTLLTKRHEHAATDHRSGFGGDTVRKDHVERHGQGNVAEFGH